MCSAVACVQCCLLVHWVLGLVLFNLFIKELNCKTEWTFNVFTDDTKLEGTADAWDECVAIQKDLDRLENWADRNVRKFNKGICKVLHQESNDYRHCLGNEHLEGSLQEEDLETSSLETCTNWPCMSSKVGQEDLKMSLPTKMILHENQTFYAYYWSNAFKRQRSNREWKGSIGYFIFISILNFPFGKMEALKMTSFPLTHSWNLLPGPACIFCLWVSGNCYCSHPFSRPKHQLFFDRWFLLIWWYQACLAFGFWWELLDSVYLFIYLTSFWF